MIPLNSGESDGIGRDDLDECWCCGGLHDSFGSLCPSCDDAGCNRFSDECDSDHKPVLPDGGQDGVGTTLSNLAILATETDEIDPPDDTLETGRCRACETSDVGLYDESDVFSGAFTASNRLAGGDGVCWRCKYLADQTDYRRYHWIATASDGIEITKDRQELLTTLRDPPAEPWMIQIVSDFRNTLNGWIAGQRLNTSREGYRIIYDRDCIHLDRETVDDLATFAADLRERDLPKGVMRSGPSAHDLDRFDLTRAEHERLHTLASRQDWDLIVTLVE